MKTISCFVTFVLIFVVLGRAADAPSYGFTLQETERYIVWPGQACSYMIGQLRILELREKAKTMLGPKFFLKAFHNLVLRAAQCHSTYWPPRSTHGSRRRSESRSACL
jgi:hypothetical protein